MFKVRKRLAIPIIVLLVVSTSALIFVSIAIASGWNIIDLPSFDRPDKGNPKLDSQLNQLVSAERLGEAESFAEQSNIELIEGSVRVIIECAPDQVDNAMLASHNAGATIEMDYDNLLQVVVPINKLTTLTDAESIHFIRLPHLATPGTTGKD